MFFNGSRWQQDPPTKPPQHYGEVDGLFYRMYQRGRKGHGIGRWHKASSHTEAKWMVERTVAIMQDTKAWYPRIRITVEQCPRCKMFSPVSDDMMDDFCVNCGDPLPHTGRFFVEGVIQQVNKQEGG